MMLDSPTQCSVGNGEGGTLPTNNLHWNEQDKYLTQPTVDVLTKDKG